MCSHTCLTYVPESLVHFRIHNKATTFINTSAKKFRTNLDELVFYHEMLFHSVYRPLRFYASQCQPPVDINQQFASRVQAAYKYARQASNSHSSSGLSQLEDMNELANLFPGFKVVRKIPFSLSFEKYIWNIKKLLTEV